MRRAYQTDLSDEEWSHIKPHLPAPSAPGRPRLHALREVLDAIFYIVRSGCAWRLLPNDFPPWKTIHHYFRTWRIDGTWERMHEALRKRLRVRMKRNPEPSAGVVDSQSVKTTGVGGEQRGYDGAKKTTGRKRHLLVDTQGLELEAKVHSANVQDREGIKTLLEPTPDRLPRLNHLWLDAGYTGQDKARQGRRLGGKDAWLDSRDSTPPAQAGPRGGDDEVGQGVGQRGACHRSKKAVASEESQAILAEEVGGGTHILVVGTKPQDE